MYGYIIPDKPNLYMKDFALYRSFYCGICKAIPKFKYGQAARLTINYDITFFAVLVHSYLGIRPEYITARCLYKCAGKKKVMVKPSEMLGKIAALNILMAYHKLTDDIIDGDGKRFLRGLIKSAYKKARKVLPEAEAVITQKYAALRELEKAGCGSVDRAADCFAAMLRDCAKIIINAQCTMNNEHFDDFVYFLGKFIYIIDAADDIDQDITKAKYNPLAKAFGSDESTSKRGKKDSNLRTEFYSKNKQELDELIYGCINKMRSSFEALRLTEAVDLLSNFVFYGFERKYKQVIESAKKLKQEKV